MKKIMLMTVCAAALGLAACGDSSSDGAGASGGGSLGGGYSDATRDTFMTQYCGDNSADAAQEQMCGCMYDYFEANLDYDEYAEFYGIKINDGDVAAASAAVSTASEKCSEELVKSLQ